ncbi:MAG: two component transcriptional regulator, winged helix family [Acidimicrobiales bacterium]|nr:two component transcriptional regulator, winged helix family [Acidimicrobiales bacterium]
MATPGPPIGQGDDAQEPARRGPACLRGRVMRILLVEDDIEITNLVRVALRRDAHVVEGAGTCAEGLWYATEFAFDVVILDRDLPDGDGLDVCRSLRQRGAWVPVLVLSGRNQVRDRVDGLNAGADDYLVKPFALSELGARLRALVRRTPHERPTTLSVGDLVLDPAARTVTRNGTCIELRPKEFALLELFMRRKDEALSRAEILDQAWDMAYDGMSNVVDVHVKSLRAKIDRPYGTTTIETVRSIGYRLVSESSVRA